MLPRIQADILCADEDRAQALYDQLISQAPNYMAVGKDQALFEPTKITLLGTYDDEDHQTDIVVSDPAIAQEIYDLLIAKHPEYADTLKRTFSTSFIQIHDCYHDENPPRPCEIKARYEVSPTDAIEKGIPVVGSIVNSGTIQVITADFEARVLEAKAAREAKTIPVIDEPIRKVI